MPVSDKLYWFATGARAQGGRVVTVEAKPENAAVARAVVKYAKQDRVEVFGGKLAEDALPDVYAALGRPADLIFMEFPIGGAGTHTQGHSRGGGQRGIQNSNDTPLQANANLTSD